MLEIRVTAPTEEAFVKHIIWNADEIKSELSEKVKYYMNLVYTDAQVTEAKKDRAGLNKFIQALKAKDKEIKDLCLAPYNEFHTKMMEIINLVQEPADLIDQQVKGFEEEQKRKKMQEIQELYDSKGFWPWVSLENPRIWNPKWLNKTYSLKQINADLTHIQHEIGEEILSINGLQDGVEAALSAFKRTLDLKAAFSAASQYVAAKKAEEAKRAEEELTNKLQAQPVQAAPAPMPTVETPTTPPPAPQNDLPLPVRKEIMFKVFVTRQEMEKLSRFLVENNYTFRQVKAPAAQ